jgi:hypothetical protein
VEQDVEQDGGLCVSISRLPVEPEYAETYRLFVFPLFLPCPLIRRLTSPLLRRAPSVTSSTLTVHGYFRQAFKQLYELSDGSFERHGLNARDFMDVGEQFLRHLEGHHGIEERYVCPHCFYHLAGDAARPSEAKLTIAPFENSHIFPILSKRMPQFAEEHQEEHDAIHEGMHNFEVRLFFLLVAFSIFPFPPFLPPSLLPPPISLPTPMLSTQSALTLYSSPGLHQQGPRRPDRLLAGSFPGSSRVVGTSVVVPSQR